MVEISAGQRRRGLAAIVVEFVLIVVAVISSGILGGFVFGLFGTYVPPAEVSAQVSSCSSAGGEVCHVTLTNVGVRSVATTTVCSLALSGSDAPGTLTNGGTIPAGGSLSTVNCVVNGVEAQQGSRLAGSIPLSNGATVFFEGTAS